MAKPYTQEEMDYIEDKFGTLSYKAIAKHLGRSENAIFLKAQRMGLGNPTMSMADKLTIVSLAQAINKEYTEVVNWEKYGLPVKKKRFRNKAVKVIAIKDFWNWAYENMNMLDFTKIEKFAIGPEPDWVEEKRNADYRKRFYIPFHHTTPWAKEEDALLEHLVKLGSTYPEIMKRIKRSQGAIKRRLLDLKIKERPIRTNNHIKWTDEEIKCLVESIEKGISIEEIADTLGKTQGGTRGKLERLGYKFKNKVPYKDVAS